MKKICAIALLVFIGPSFSYSQPVFENGTVVFTFPFAGEKSVSLVGDFNGWSREEDPMKRNSSGDWQAAKRLTPGIFQYKFVVDGKIYVMDGKNPATIENYNKSDLNSVFVLTEDEKIQLTSTPPNPKANLNDEYLIDSRKKPVFLNIIWHQHQPLYVNPEKDQLSGPWVRTHATKDYYDMAAMLTEYPDIHCTINLTSSLLHQLREYYVARLAPFVDTRRNTIDIKGFQKKWKGKTDPWIDLALKKTEEFGEVEKGYLWRNTWNAFGMSEVMIERFPEYRALKQKTIVDQMPGGELFTVQEMREIKFWFYLAYFDPDFLRGPVNLPDGSVCDLSGYVEERSDGRFYLKKEVTEADCHRMVVEAYKVAANVIPIHKKLGYDHQNRNGQVEVITTPYYHPILPLIYDSGLARTAQRSDPMPTRFSYPQDAEAQIVKAVRMYTEVFGRTPTGMWPGEGSVAQPVLPLLRRNGILWTASDEKVLKRSEPVNQPNLNPYRFDAGVGGSRETMALVFRDTELSDRIGFKYQNYRGEEAAEDFVRTILERAPYKEDDDGLVTVILDGENAWEWYRYDNDGKEFLHALYRKLSKLFSRRQVITTTMVEYIHGNPARGIPQHPMDAMKGMDWLWPGSWINGNYDTWIGEEEENRAWEYLLRARQDIESSGLRQPDPRKDPPKEGSKAWHAYMAWEAMYAAEGSDWFWWYGKDQSAPAGDKPFDVAFLTHLENVYTFAQLAGATIASPGFDPIIGDDGSFAGGQGTMAKSRDESQQVIIAVDASRENVTKGIYIVGNLKVVGEWTPNSIIMYDDGTHGDRTAGDGIWSISIDLPVGVELQYKFTNSGRKGEWTPSEEFPQRHRTYVATKKSDSPVYLEVVFGK